MSREFPEDGFLGEERGSRNADAAAVWVIDPIDGTHNFLTGIPFWCVSVGLVVAGELVARDHLSSARRRALLGAKGRRRLPERAGDQGERLRLTLRAPASASASAIVGPVDDHVRAVEALLSAGCEYLRLGSGALGLAYTAAGRFDGYWERHINSWDAAAGLVLVREAGGRTNDFLAGDGLTQGSEILAATPALFEPLKPMTTFGRPG